MVKRPVSACTSIVLAVLTLLGLAALNGWQAQADVLSQTDTPTPIPTLVLPTPTMPFTPSSPQIEVQSSSGVEMRTRPNTNLPSLPDTLNLPDMPELSALQFPATWDLPSFAELPEYAVPELPTTLDLPSMPELNAPAFPTTLNLPAIPEMPGPPSPPTFTIPSPPTVADIDLPDTLSLTVAGFTNPVFPEVFPVVTDSLTSTEGISGEVSGLLAAWAPAQDEAEELRDDVLSTYGDPEAATVAGYTAEEMAAEMVSGLDLSMSYVRALGDIGVIGPTAVAMVVGLAWIAFVIFAKIFIKANLTLLDIVFRVIDIVANVL